MKVIHLMAPGPFGGAEKVVTAGASELSELNVDIEVWVIKELRQPHHAEEFIAHLPTEMKTRRFETSGAISLGLFTALSKAFRKLPTNAIVHTHGFKAAAYASFARPPGLHIHTHHGNTSHTLKVRLYEAIERWIMRRIPEVHAVSETMHATLRKEHILSNCVPNPLLLTPVSPLPFSTPLKLVFVGRLSPEKGLDVLLQALRGFTKDQLSLTVVGDGGERAKLEAMADEKVTFVGFQKNVADFLAQAHALVLPSLREGLPLTLIEATACGLPVIASRVGGVPELITEGENGILVTPGEVVELSEAMATLLLDYPRFRTGALRSSILIQTKYGLRGWAEKTISSYKRLSQSAVL